MSSFAIRFFGTGVLLDLCHRGGSNAASTRSGGIEREMSRAEVVSHSMISLAPLKRSPIHDKTWWSAGFFIGETYCSSNVS
jgi:hypothetical protein